MPRFPDYVAQKGLAVPSAPQIQANIAVGKSLNDFGQTLEEAGRRFTVRQKQQADFDDQIAYQRYPLAQGQNLQQAQAAMPAEATGFHDAVMAGRAQADDAFLQTVSPGNRQTYAGLLAQDRDRTSLAAARMELAGRGAYEQAAFGQSAAAMADQVRSSPNLLPSALDVLKAQQANQSSVPQAARDAQWLTTKQALQLAHFQGRYGDDPAGEGLAALGFRPGDDNAAALPLLMDEGPVDPSLDALTPMQRQQAALQLQTNQTQKQAAARADLAGLQQRLAAMPLSGQLDGPPPDRDTFVTAYGPGEGGRRFDEAGAFLKDVPQITALLRQPDGAQDAALRQYAAAGDTDGQRFYRNAAAAVARYRSERAADPVGTLGKLYPDLGRQWDALEGADPDMLRQALPQLVDQTAELMDAGGIPAGDQRYLPPTLATALVRSSQDAGKTLAERVAPLEAVLASVRNPDLQRTIFAQCVKSGLPPMLQPAAAALARGEQDTAARLAEAVLVPPPKGDNVPDTKDPPDPPSSPLALAGQSTPFAIRSIAPLGGLLALPSNAVGFGDELDRANRTGLLFTRLAQHGLAYNGGDLGAAVAQAKSDVFGSQPILPGDMVLPVGMTGLERLVSDNSRYALNQNANGSGMSDGTAPPAGFDHISQNAPPGDASSTDGDDPTRHTHNQDPDSYLELLHRYDDANPSSSLDDATKSKTEENLKKLSENILLEKARIKDLINPEGPMDFTAPDQKNIVQFLSPPEMLPDSNILRNFPLIPRQQPAGFPKSQHYLGWEAPLSPEQYTPIFDYFSSKNNINPNFLRISSRIESTLPGSGHPDFLNAWARVGRKVLYDPATKKKIGYGDPATSAAGLFQFLDGPAHDHHLLNKYDPIESTKAAVQLAIDNAHELQKLLGRPPTIGEVYLAHQQGASGAAKLILNPDDLARSQVSDTAVSGNTKSKNGKKALATLTSKALSDSFTKAFPDEPFFIEKTENNQ